MASSRGRPEAHPVRYEFLRHANAIKCSRMQASNWQRCEVFRNPQYKHDAQASESRMMQKYSLACACLYMAACVIENCFTALPNGDEEKQPVAYRYFDVTLTLDLTLTHSFAPCAVRGYGTRSVPATLTKLYLSSGLRV